jgi:excisionase family DNA binding protein
MTVLTVNEAAALARVSPRTIVRAAERGEFRFTRVGVRSIRIPREPFLEWLWGPDWRRVCGGAPTQLAA